MGQTFLGGVLKQTQPAKEENLLWTWQCNESAIHVHWGLCTGWQTKAFSTCFLHPGRSTQQTSAVGSPRGRAPDQPSWSNGQFATARVLAVSSFRDKGNSGAVVPKSLFDDYKFNMILEDVGSSYSHYNKSDRFFSNLDKFG